MATTTNITTTYAGEFARKYISEALLSAITLEKGGIDVRPNVKYKEVMKKVNLEGIIADATCDFTDTGVLNLTERILEPKELQVNVKLCKKTFRSDWEAIQMGVSAHDQLPPDFQSFIIAEMISQVAQNNERSIWEGDSSINGQYDGFVKLLSLDPLLPVAQEVAGTAITSANVIDELGKVADAIPSTLYGREDMYIYVSQKVFRAYVRALGGFGAAGLGAQGIDNKGTTHYDHGSTLNFDGTTIFLTNGLTGDKMVATYKDNLAFGTGLLSDHNEVKLIDTGDTLGDQNVRFVMRMTGGVQYGIVEDIVTYGIVNAAND
jgi:hypothetical protein